MAGGVINLALSVIQVGPGLTLNGSTLSATQGVAVKATRNVTGNTTVTANDYYVGYTGAGTATFTLVAANVSNGVELIIKNRGTGNLTLDATASGGFWGISLVNTWTLYVGDSLHLMSDGITWSIVACASGVPA